MPDVNWEENDTITVRVSDKTHYVFAMYRDPNGYPRVRVRRDDMVERHAEWVDEYKSDADDNLADKMLLFAIKKHAGVDYGCEDD